MHRCGYKSEFHNRKNSTLIEFICQALSADNPTSRKVIAVALLFITNFTSKVKKCQIIFVFLTTFAYMFYNICSSFVYVPSEFFDIAYLYVGLESLHQE